jgi:hypothetical protein
MQFNNLKLLLFLRKYFKHIYIEFLSELMLTLVREFSVSEIN